MNALTQQRGDGVTNIAHTIFDVNRLSRYCSKCTDRQTDGQTGITRR